MSEKSVSSDTENYTTIKAAKQEATYLENVSGDQSINESGKTHCDMCGLTARNPAELDEHTKIAHQSQL